jgi:hypothetical protein
MGGWDQNGSWGRLVAGVWSGFSWLRIGIGGRLLNTVMNLQVLASRSYSWLVLTKGIYHQML